MLVPELQKLHFPHLKLHLRKLTLKMSHSSPVASGLWRALNSDGEGVNGVGFFMRRDSDAPEERSLMSRPFFFVKGNTDGCEEEERLLIARISLEAAVAAGGSDEGLPGALCLSNVEVEILWPLLLLLREDDFSADGCVLPLPPAVALLPLLLPLLLPEDGSCCFDVLIDAKES